MKAYLLLAPLCWLVSSGVVTQAAYPDGGAFPVKPGPQPGSVGKVQTFTAWVDGDSLNILADAGLPVVAGTHYQRWQGRSWQLTDGGADVAPNWGPAVILESTAQSVCASATLCIAYDGGIDRAAAASHACACAKDSTCLLTSTSNPAPHGVTLQPGTFTGAGCQPKSCVALWTNVMAYAGEGTANDSSWPLACPLQ